MAKEHRTLTGAELHEPKGVAAAAAGQVYVANGAGSGTWTKRVQVGFLDYNDLETATTAITVAGTGTFVPLTNDGAGPNTNKTYKPTGVTEVWNTTTNKFDFSELSLGDVVDIRLDIDVIVATANTEVEVALELADGTGSDYDVTFVPTTNYKGTGTKKLVSYVGIYMGDNNTKNNPAFFKIKSDTACTVRVNGWYCKITKA